MYLILRETEGSPTSCYAHSSKEYTGQIHITKDGRICQRWSDNSPHSHTFGDDDFPDDTIEDAQNFCRDPDSIGTPWCFTLDVHRRWEESDIEKCKPLEGKINITKETNHNIVNPKFSISNAHNNAIPNIMNGKFLSLCCLCFEIQLEMYIRTWNVFSILLFLKKCK